MVTVETKQIAGGEPTVGTPPIDDHPPIRIFHNKDEFVMAYPDLAKAMYGLGNDKLKAKVYPREHQ